MRPQAAVATNVVRFPGPRSAKTTGLDQKSLLDTVYTNGVLVIHADDRETKSIASRLQVFGFLNVAEILMDGSIRPMKASEAASASLARPWRLSRPAWDDLPPLAG